VLGRLGVEEGKFKASLGYIAKPCFKQTNKRKKEDKRRWTFCSVK
jgi:hypothetical protein